jgi:hypothetical protein
LSLDRNGYEDRPLRVSLPSGKNLRRRYRTPSPPSFPLPLSLPLPLNLLRPVRLRQCQGSRWVLRVDSDVEDAGLPGVAVVGRDGEVGVASGGEEDDAETAGTTEEREARGDEGEGDREVMVIRQGKREGREKTSQLA